MSPYSSFAVVGTGGFGNYIVNALRATGKAKSIIVLGRLSSTAQKNHPSDVEVVKVDYNDTASVTEVLRTHQVDVVISAINANEALLTQKIIGEAAKKAGVKLFVPSEYGKDTTGLAAKEKSFFATKDEVALYLQSIGLPTARIFNGLFIEYIPWAVGYDATERFNIVNEGDPAFPVTAEDDISGFIAYILTELPASQVENKEFHIQGERVSFITVAKRYGKEAVYVDKVPGEGSEIRTLISREVQHVEGVEAFGNSNNLWVGHVWKKVEDVLTL